MQTIKKQSLLLIIAGAVIMLSACGKTKAENINTPERVPVVNIKLEEKAEKKPDGDSSLKIELEKAHKAGKAAFVVVSGSGTTETEKALAIAESAKNIYQNAMVIQMNRDDAANAELVKEWRLEGAPLPLILVVSPKGVLTGGRILAQATAENLASLLPSPKLETVYDALGNNKYAIVAFTKKSFTDRQEVLKQCNEAVLMLKNEAVMVEVDMDDKMEKGFMEQVGIDPVTLNASVTLVINKQGQVAGTSTTVPSAAKLAAAALTPVRGGCGPGCGPAGCGQ